jgi:ABC-type sulfate transport system permease component
MTEFIQNNQGVIAAVLFLMVLPFYIKKVQEYSKASQKKTKARKQRLKR